MNETMRGRTALVTGASTGIGKAVARSLAEAGLWVGMIARTESRLVEAAKEVGGHAVAADLSSPPDVHRVTTYLAELLGEAPDLLVNCVGTFELAPLEQTDPELFERQIAANLRGPFLMIRALLPLMLERGSGQIVNVGSVAGRVAFPGNAAYSASKYGLRGLHEVMAEEVRGRGVRVTMIEPAATDTPLWDSIDPDSREDLPSRSAMLRPEDVARAVLFSVSQPPNVELPLISIRATG